jgi:hypothetical protein
MCEGKTEVAMSFYVSRFPEVIDIVHHGPGEADTGVRGVDLPEVF